jgi:hypothetical protein
MTQVHLLGANASYDTHKQTVVKNQIIQLNGCDNDRYVVYSGFFIAIVLYFN